MLLITNEDGLGNDFYEFEAVVPVSLPLLFEEGYSGLPEKIAGLIGYALRETLAGEELELCEAEALDEGTALRLAFATDLTITITG